MNVSNSRSTIVETASGKVRGLVDHDVCVFRGIHYGTQTGGRNRFRPASHPNWPGVRDATEFGPRCPQLEPTGATYPWQEWLKDTHVQSEDCLTLNVFTESLSVLEPRPVMVYFHGGGFSVGSANAAGTSGENLARRGVVVVSLNHRLNVFGHLFLQRHEETRFSGNIGLLDCVLALGWVRENISRFGGDPWNITIFGQSGGGSKVAALLAMPQARGLFQKAIVQSASSLLSLASQEEAERNTFHFLRATGATTSTVQKLSEMKPDELLAAMRRSVMMAGGVDDFRPVVDGEVVVSQPFGRRAVELSTDVPLIIGWCDNELRLNLALSPHVADMAEHTARERVASLLSGSDQEIKDLFAVYKQTRPSYTAGELYLQIIGDFRYRRSLIGAAERQATNGVAPVFTYALDWKSPVCGGRLGTPHTLCIAFVFGNHEASVPIAGRGAAQEILRAQMSNAWVEFARSGRPRVAGLPKWSAFSKTSRDTILFNEIPELVRDPRSIERVALGTFAEYKPGPVEGAHIAAAGAPFERDENRDTKGLTGEDASSPVLRSDSGVRLRF
ncbi:carboxylesterase, type B [Caballeronia calidae]|uniref:Carboxylic ester hydrolase n=1 Tax=Caballeronia calidae TaxID=1777139 RepID=A0A158EGS8_9BURK|nr:carboxylesterase family protein [Caballeronia calidae]SAL05616.1 carboxylesterase, type B [Caballeronia calidae]